jgi:hypothetical protein
VFLQKSTESRFGFEDFPEEGRNPRYLNHIAPRIYKLATKVGDGTMTLADPPEAMYAVAKNVGGERADNFYARDEERRESTLTLPYSTHTSLKLASNILHAPSQNEEQLQANRMSLTVNICRNLHLIVRAYGVLCVDVLAICCEKKGRVGSVYSERESERKIERDRER